MNKMIALISCIFAVIEKKNFDKFAIIIQAILMMCGRIIMKGFNRWNENGGSYSSINCFFTRD